MKKVISSTDGGGFAEANKLSKKLFKHPINTRTATPQEIAWVMDASTPVPNCRPVEIFTALWALQQLPGRTIATDVSFSGTVGEYAEFWGKNEFDEIQLNNWYDFYSNIHFIKKDELRPFAPIICAGGIATDLCKLREERIKEVARALGITGIGRVIVSELSNLTTETHVSLGAIFPVLPIGKTIGSFPCPICSSSEKHVVYHAVRKTDAGYVVTDPRSSRVVKCKGTRAFTSQVSALSNLGDVMRTTGLVLNGLAAFKAIELAAPVNTNFFVRDYSNPRGTLATLFDWWKERLWITTRCYLVKNTESKEDLEWETFLTLVSEEPEFFLEALSTPFLSGGKELLLTLE